LTASPDGQAAREELERYPWLKKTIKRLLRPIWLVTTQASVG
jgi:hypothetical protein